MKRTLYFTETEHEQLVWLSNTLVEHFSEIVRRLIAEEYIAFHTDAVKMGAVDADELPHPADAPAIPLIITKKARNG